MSNKFPSTWTQRQINAALDHPVLRELVVDYLKAIAEQAAAEMFDWTAAAVLSIIRSNGCVCFINHLEDVLQERFAKEAFGEGE